mgnify:FL=1
MEEYDDEYEDDEEEECTLGEAKNLFDECIRIANDWRDIDPKEFQWLFKKGREPDVLGYLLMSGDARMKIVN